MAEKEIPGTSGEGDVDDDRQDPPTPQKRDAEGRDDGELDGFTATPGDDADDEDQ